MHRSSRSHRCATAAAHLCLAVALTGGVVTLGSPPAEADTTTTRTATTSADLSPPRATGILPRALIPDAAMLQAADLGGATPTPVTDDYWSALRPPQPCSDHQYPGAALRRTDRAVSALIDVDGRPTVVMEHVAIYRADGAHRYLRELRRALKACGGVDAQGSRWSVLVTGVVGDESMLLRRREYIAYADTYKNTYLVVSRTGRVLVVLADTGWETADGHSDLARELSVAAVRRAAVLNRR
jgi:hypothetical protein